MPVWSAVVYQSAVTGGVTAAVVGRLGAAQFAGVGVGTTMTLVLSSCFMFISVLMTPFVARRLAEGKKEQVRERTVCRGLTRSRV